jgi:hypothetical protein
MLLLLVLVLVSLVFSFYKRTDFNQFYQIQHKKRGTHGLESEAFNCAYGATP